MLQSLQIISKHLQTCLLVKNVNLRNALIMNYKLGVLMNQQLSLLHVLIVVRIGRINLNKILCICIYIIQDNIWYFHFLSACSSYLLFAVLLRLRVIKKNNNYIQFRLF